MTFPITLEEVNIAVIGLGYVGLPLAVELSNHFPITGYDVDSNRIASLRAGDDKTGEVEGARLSDTGSLNFTDDPTALASCNVYLVAVPTPVHLNKLPDLGPLLAASATVGRHMRGPCVVIFESTVYPGATEEECVPVLERSSGLKLNQDFFVGYSPERINPGDRQRRISDIIKVTSGSTPEAARFIDAIYRTIIRAGTHCAPSIKVAEAAKAVENTQRDINIAFANELAMIFHRLGIDTEEVLRAAETKWNFMPVRPGLVGGHCIGVDPYYLIHKAEMVQANPRLIKAAREINEGMSEYVANRLVMHMARAGLPLPGSRILILGLTFKEDCPDLRNTRVVEISSRLADMNALVDIHDPWADPGDAAAELGVTLCEHPDPESYDAILLAVAHKVFRNDGANMVRRFLKPNGVVMDVKYALQFHGPGSRL